MYVDVLLLVNFLFNLFILTVTSYLSQLVKPFRRLLMGAMLGSLFSLTVIYTVPGILLKLLFSFLMILASFWPFSLPKGLKIWGFFYLVTFLTGGTILAFAYLFQGEVSFFRGALCVADITYLCTVAALAVVLLLVRSSWLTFTETKRTAAWRGKVTIRHKEKEVRLEALIDTGNKLREPVTGMPVIVVYYGEVKSLFEDNIDLEREKIDSARLTERLIEHTAQGIYIIPFVALGGKNGFLPGFRPEEVAVTLGSEEKRWRKGQVIVGLSPEKIPGDGSFEALVNPGLII